METNLLDAPSQLSTTAFRRPEVAGKFLTAKSAKFFVQGVTYGTFAPDANGNEYDPEATERDFAHMAANGINAVRVYTVPPRWLLDLAQRHGLRVMVGLPWEQHIAFLDEPGRARAIEQRVRAGVEACAGHPAVLCYAVGNEMPAPIVRWLGRRRVEQFLRRLTGIVKAVDPSALVTYVNYPSTEYLELPFLDIVCFNVYLEKRNDLARYLARLQTLAGDRPLLLAEIGLDSRRHGEDGQARSLDWQVQTALAAGCAGTFVFAWTDEWYRGGFAIEDWDFGLTTRARQPKLALAAVSAAYAKVPFPADGSWPRISVVVCSYNGSRTIEDCLEGLRHLVYPDYEVIVVDDGSTDATAAIAAAYDIRLIQTENRGLSSARNTGLAAATGEIVAYIDDDARPDPDWLTYLAATFRRTEYAAVGGPNIVPPDDGFIAQCVACAPGGPNHVLLTDEVAEHLPGCNLAIRRDRLLAIGGFDPRFRVAGDDVDVCWRLQDAGWTLGFCPAAMVWHHRRNSLRAYWRQQVGYGRAEAKLEAKWPARYNAAGHVPWQGQIYGTGLTRSVAAWRGRIYQGVWGAAPFQRMYAVPAGIVSALPLMPEWYLIIGALVVLAVLGCLWSPLLLVIPLLALAIAAPICQAIWSAVHVAFADPESTWFGVCRRSALVALLHLVQPLARLRGRLQYGLSPWRRRSRSGAVWPRPRQRATWSETWRPQEAWLQELMMQLQQGGCLVRLGGSYDGWDLEVQGGVLGAARVLAAVEEHGAGKQLVRYRIWSRMPAIVIMLLAGLALLTILALFDRAWIAGALLGICFVLLIPRALWECAAAESAILSEIGIGLPARVSPMAGIKPANALVAEDER